MAQDPRKLFPGPLKAAVPRPEYGPALLESAMKFAMLGARGAIMAVMLGFKDQEELDIWLGAYPDLARAIREGAEVADSIVAQSLFKRANGYDVRYKKVKLKPDPEGVKFKDPDTGELIGEIRHAVTDIEIGHHHIPPDVRAIELWLYNRQPDLWSKSPSARAPGDNPGAPDVEEDVIEIIYAKLQSMRARAAPEPRRLEEDPESPVD